MRLRSAVIILLLGFLQPVVTIASDENEKLGDIAEDPLDFIQQILEATKPPYEGLKEIFVLVENLLQEHKNLGLSKIQLQTDAELKLRLAGINVVGNSSASNGAFIYIVVNGIKAPNEHIAYYLEVRLSEPARLNRVPLRPVPGISWSQSAIGIVPRAIFVSTAREGIKDYLDQFLNDYLAANPKE